MSSQNSLDVVLKGQPLEVDIAAIEEQLRELWKGAAQEDIHDEESTRPVARTSVLNLVVYLEDPSSEQRITEAISELTMENPCRAIVVTALQGQGVSSIEAWISAHCHRPSPTSKVMCCEQVSLRACGTSVRELAPTVVPLLISDLPVFVWWKGSRLFESEFLEGISDVCDRLILDSKSFDSPEVDFPRLEEYIQTRSDRLAVSDVAWHRLKQWRELTAQFFDAPVLRAHLNHIEKVTVEFNERAVQRSGVPPQAFLLVGWLASRLHWEIIGTETQDATRRFHLRARDGGRPITAEICPADARPELSGHLVSFEIATGEDWATAFRIAKGGNPNCAQTEIAFAHLPPYRRVIPLRIYNEVELIARQLEVFGHDRIYEDAIAMASALVKTSRST